MSSSPRATATIGPGRPSAFGGPPSPSSTTHSAPSRHCPTDMRSSSTSATFGEMLLTGPFALPGSSTATVSPWGTIGGLYAAPGAASRRRRV